MCFKVAENKCTFLEGLSEPVKRYPSKMLSNSEVGTIHFPSKI